MRMDNTKTQTAHHHMQFWLACTRVTAKKKYKAHWNHFSLKYPKPPTDKVGRTKQQPRKGNTVNFNTYIRSHGIAVVTVGHQNYALSEWVGGFDWVNVTYWDFEQVRSWLGY